MSTVAITDQEFGQFQRFIFDNAGITLSAAKKALVCGRLGKRLQHHALGSYGEYLRLLRSGRSLEMARKAPIILGLLLSSSIIGANFVEKSEYVIAFMCLAFFGNGMASIGWSLVSHVAPRRLIGLTGGTFNFISNLSGISTPLIIGYLAANGNFAPGLAYIATVALMGALAYILMIGKLERVE